MCCMLDFKKWFTKRIASIMLEPEVFSHLPELINEPLCTLMLFQECTLTFLEGSCWPVYKSVPGLQVLPHSQAVVLSICLFEVSILTSSREMMSCYNYCYTIQWTLWDNIELMYVPLSLQCWSFPLLNRMIFLMFFIFSGLLVLTHQANLSHLFFTSH